MPKKDKKKAVWNIILKITEILFYFLKVSNTYPHTHEHTFAYTRHTLTIFPKNVSRETIIIFSFLFTLFSHNLVTIL